MDMGRGGRECCAGGWRVPPTAKPGVKRHSEGGDGAGPSGERSGKQSHPPLPRAGAARPAMIHRGTKRLWTRRTAEEQRSRGDRAGAGRRAQWRDEGGANPPSPSLDRLQRLCGSQGISQACIRREERGKDLSR